MLIWTTKGPKRAEKTVATDASEEAFAESSEPGKPAADQAKPAKDSKSADVFIDGSATPTETAAVEDDEWTNAEAQRAKSPAPTE